MIATCNNLVSSWSTFRLMKSHNVLKEFCDKNGISVINLSSSEYLICITMMRLTILSNF